VRFVNEAAGEYWFKLHLIGTDAPPDALPEMSAPLGERCAVRVPVDNPLAEEVVLTTSTSNARNFPVRPKEVVIGPMGTGEFLVEYCPSSVEDVEHGVVSIGGSKVARWNYEVKGRGSPPNAFALTEVAAVIRHTTTSALLFMNPLASDLKLDVRFECEVEGVFALMMKRTKSVAVPALGSLQLPFSFCPETMATHEGTIVLEAARTDGHEPLRWLYPVKGMAEVSPESSKNSVFRFSTKARTELEKDIEIHLYGLAEGVADEPFTHNLLFAEAERAMLERNLHVQALDDVITNADTPLRFRVRFNPMKVRVRLWELLSAHVVGVLREHLRPGHLRGRCGCARMVRFFCNADAERLRAQEKPLLMAPGSPGVSLDRGRARGIP
jgi:hypothetical protein